MTAPRNDTRAMAGTVENRKIEMPRCQSETVLHQNCDSILKRKAKIEMSDRSFSQHGIKLLPNYNN